MEQDKQFIEQRKRKFLIMLPVLTVPFLLLLFYSLGGGKGEHNKTTSRSSALSTTLPDPLLDESQPMDKLSLYERAAKDSEEQQRTALNDPFAAWMPVDTVKTLPPAPKSPFSYPTTDQFEEPGPYTYQPVKKTPEAELEQKIAQLEKALKTPDASIAADTTPSSLPQADISPELQRLESLMQSFSGQPVTPDPELSQAETLMDKILDVQHPERVRQRIKDQSTENKKMVYPVSAMPKEEPSDLLTGSTLNMPLIGLPTNGFVCLQRKVYQYSINFKGDSVT